MSEFLVSGGSADEAPLHEHMTRAAEREPSTSLRSDLWVSLRDPTLFGLRWLRRLKRLARWTVYQIINA